MAMFKQQSAYSLVLVPKEKVYYFSVCLCTHKGKRKVVPLLERHTTKMCEEIVLKLPAFLTLVLDGNE